MLHQHAQWPSICNSMIANDYNNDDKWDDNMKVCSDTFSEIHEDNVSNCFVNRDTKLDDSDPTAVKLQHNPYETNTHMELNLQQVKVMCHYI